MFVSGSQCGDCFFVFFKLWSLLVSSECSSLGLSVVVSAQCADCDREVGQCLMLTVLTKNMPEHLLPIVW